MCHASAFSRFLRSFHCFHMNRIVRFHQRPGSFEVSFQFFLVGEINLGFHGSWEAVEVRVGGDVPATLFHYGHARHIAPEAAEAGVSRQSNARAPVGEFGDADDMLSLSSVLSVLVLSIPVAYADVAAVAHIYFIH